MRTLSALLGRCHELQTFELLADNLDYPLTPPDLVEMSDIPRTTVYRTLERFANAGIVRVVGRIGKANRYVLNLERPVVAHFAAALSNASLDLMEEERLPEMPSIVIARAAFDSSEPEPEFEEMPSETTVWGEVPNVRTK